MTNDERPQYLPFLTVFAGMVLSACALMLMVPVLFRSHDPWLEWLAAAIGFLFVVLGWATRRMRPDVPETVDPKSGL
ncbi:hypothetical protein ATL42_0902 [Sanguibacter antarcticus]|uniref:Uncharacterized protein n=1 Tax=Sanguibacter antarcticus TaxID=372484 RepID=A0A2A9E1X8_9MICO|nr:hypothetical protein ATL42_0902 [Sanguibacter antarcticus]